MVRRFCAISRLFHTTFSPSLSIYHLRLFFTLLLCISIIATSLSAARLFSSRLLGQQPFLHFSALVCCIVGLIHCRGNHFQTFSCITHTLKRLRQATLCASIAITLSTLASLPTPTSASATDSTIARQDVWLLLALTLCVQVYLPNNRSRHLACGIIALAHAAMVIVTRFTSNSSTVPSTASCVECFLCWNSCDVRFWREVASNMVAFTLTNLIGWHLSCQNDLERWRCLCVSLHASVRSSTLRSTQKNLSRISRSIVPPALASDLERDFYSPPCIWSSPLVIYLRNVSFLSAELVGFYTSNGGTASGALSPLVASVGVQEVERFPQPASHHVMAFTNHLLGQIKILCENYGCYAVHVRPGEVLCIAGYPEVRVDHANSCVQLALAINRLLRSLSNSARIQLEARVAIHTGEAYAAVLGQSMLTFDLLGADVFHLRRQLRAAAKPGRVLVSRATFDQLPEGYEGELGPTVVDPSANRHVVHCETLYVQPRKSGDTSVSSAECVYSRWPTLGESISTGGLAQAFARLAHQINTEGGESSTSTQTSTSMSFLRQMRLKEGRTGEEDEVDLCLSGRCEHRCLPTASTLTKNPCVTALESHLLPSPPSSLLTSLCHNFPSSSPSLLHPPQPSPRSSAPRSASPPPPLPPPPPPSFARFKHGSCEELPPTPTKCDSCPAHFVGPQIDTLCPLAETVLWCRLFLRRGRLKALRSALAWMMLTLMLLGIAGGLLVTRISFALIVYPCVVAWTLLLLIAFSISRLDNSSCFPVTLRQACVVFTIFLLLASLLFILMFVPFEIQQPISGFTSPWQRTPQLSTTTLLACLSLLLLLTLTPSIPPTPLNSAIVAAIFSGLHITFAFTRFIHFHSADPHYNSSSFWTTVLPDSLAAHFVFVLLVCLLPWQTAKLSQWTEQWVKMLLEQKVDLIRRRFALESLLDNRIPRAHLSSEPDNMIAESCVYPSSISAVFPPREHLATAVIAVAIHGAGKGDDALEHQRSPIRSAALSQSVTTTATTSSSTASHRSREAAAIADAVRRLNRRICLIDEIACGSGHADAGMVESVLQRVNTSMSRPSLPLVKVHSVGNCVAYALLEAESKDCVSQVGLLAAFLIRLMEDLERQSLQKSGEDSRDGDEALVCRLQIGLHIGATVSGVVDGAQFLLLHETLDVALRLASAILPPLPVERSLLLASADFVASRGVDALVGAQAVGLGGGGGGGGATTAEVFLWCTEPQHTARLLTTLRPVLSALVVQPLVPRNRPKKPVTTSPNFAHPRSASSLLNSNSSPPPPPPPPPPPHKRNYAVGEARYQNHNSPLLPRRDRKMSSPLLPPRHSSPPSRWPQKTFSLDVSVDGDNVDRACFAMADVEIVNGYAQPTTRLLGHGVTTSPYCVTKEGDGYANHQTHAPALELRKTGADAKRTSITSSDNIFLAVEGACERVEASQGDGVTSLSSVSPTTTTNTHHHHSNPLYTDNEYYDEEEDEGGGGGGNDVEGVQQMGDSVSDACLDAGVEWLQRAPIVGDFSVSLISNGSNFPNYRRPSTPPSNARRTLYDPPILVGAGGAAKGSDEKRRKMRTRRTSLNSSEKDCASMDLLSTCAVPSVACEYEFETGTTDFSVNDDDEEEEEEDEVALAVAVEAKAMPNGSTRSESGDVPLLMDTSWMTSTEGGGGGGGGGADGLSSKRAEMSDSLLVETGGPLEDDFSEFSSSAAGGAAAAVTTDSCGDEDASSAHNLVAYTSDAEDDGDEDAGGVEADDSVFLPTAYYPLTDQCANYRGGGRRLPDVAPVRLPNFGAPLAHQHPHPPASPPIATAMAQPVSTPLLVDLTCPPPLHSALVTSVSDAHDVAEYDNLENAYSSAVAVSHAATGDLVAHRSGWRPRDVRVHRRGGLRPRKPPARQHHLRVNAHIVDEARRICQRLHAMGWQSALSLQTQSSPSASSSENVILTNVKKDAAGGTTILLLPPPPPPPPPLELGLALAPLVRTSRRGDYVNSYSLLRRLQAFDSGTVTTVTSQIDDDEDEDGVGDGDGDREGGDEATDDGAFDSDFPDEEEEVEAGRRREAMGADGEQRNASLLIPTDLWLNAGHPRCLSNDYLPVCLDSDDSDNDEAKSHLPRSRYRRLRAHLGGRGGGGLLALDLVLRRAANVRQLLPPELQPFVLPGCFSSVSAATTTTATTHAKSGGGGGEGDGDAAVPLQRGDERERGGVGGERRRHLLVAVRGKLKRCSSDPLLPTGVAANLDVSLI